MAGVFLSLDGIDGTGKSTQVGLLADWVRSRGRNVTVCADPGGTVIGDALRGILLDHHREVSPMAEAMLFMASRAELVHRVIRPALQADHVVISDRYLLATIAYQGYGAGLNVDDLWRIGRLATGDLEPHLVIVVDLPVEQAMVRRGRQPDRMEQRDRDYHERVRAGFLAEARHRPEVIRIVDATKPVERVHDAIRAAVVTLL
jgi:dTMP kinase